MTRQLTHPPGPLRPFVMKAMLWFAGHLTTEVAAMKNETIRKLQEIRLSAMAEAFEMQL